MTRWLAKPLVHFLTIGALLFVARSSWRVASATTTVSAELSRTIAISAAKISDIRRQWYGQTGRLPDEAELRTAIDHAIDEEVLYREALARGFDHDDEVVRQRLIAVMGFVSPDGETRDDETLYREAVRLGLDRMDLVVRRHLVQQMRLIARRPDVPRPVADAELQALRDRERERWRLPAEVRFTHVFLAESRRGPATERDARALLDTLRTRSVAPADGPVLGDPFPTAYEVRHASDRDLERLFGTSFAAALAPVEPGRWSGPIRSAYGEHLVWVQERLPARMPAVAEIRRQLLGALRAELGDERERANLAAWRAGYAVEVADARNPAAQVKLPIAPPPAEVLLPQSLPFLGD